MTVMDTALHIHGYQVRLKKTSDKKKDNAWHEHLLLLQSCLSWREKIIETLKSAH